MSKKGTDYSDAIHTIIAQVLARRVPCSTLEQRRQLFINDNGNKIKVIKQTDTSLNIKFLVIWCSVRVVPPQPPRLFFLFFLFFFIEA